MNQHEVITGMVAEMDALNARGEYGGRAAQIKRELRADEMVARYSSAGNALYRKTNGRNTTDFDAALDSYR